MRGLLLVVLAVACAGLVACSQRSDELTLVKSDDPAMTAAIAEARETLPSFWSKVDAPPAGTNTFRIKAGMPTRAGGVEHIWMDVVSHSDVAVKGRLANEPVDLEGLGLGSEVTVKSDQISDWTYEKNGKLYGAFTQRAVLDQLDPDARAEVLSLLAPTALEPETK